MDILNEDRLQKRKSASLCTSIIFSETFMQKALKLRQIKVKKFIRLTRK